MKHKHTEGDLNINFDEIKKSNNDEIKNQNDDEQKLFSIISDLDKININEITKDLKPNGNNNALLIYTHILAIFIGSFMTFIIMYYYFDNKKCKEELKKINNINANNYSDNYEYEPLK